MMGMAVTKKRAGLPRLAASRVPLGTKSLGTNGRARSYDAGIRTVSTTWMTPFD
jgi:hypothetical protein